MLQTVSAKLTNLRGSPRKLNLIAGLIRNSDVGNALVQLKYCSRARSKDLYELLRSAIANAENNHGMDIDNLFVKEVCVGKAFVMKRFHARARGRGARVLKPFSTVTIILAERG